VGVKNLRLERSRALILNFGDGYVDVDYCTDG
jgi:Cys-tRNA synthase (O-phospho-L-seryl-tRNA:Cys-tRNA synthase)